MCMNKKHLSSGIVIALILAGAFAFKYFPVQQTTNQILGKDPKNATYKIEGQSITLVDGISEIEAAPGSASKITTRYFGNEVVHDLNDDGRDDTVFLVIQQGGGTGAFFYALAALNTPNGYIGSEAFFIGDRIAPQSTRINEGKTSQGTTRKNVIEINYATRLPNEPMTANPSVGKSIWIKLDPATMQFGTVEQNFEGESL